LGCHLDGTLPEVAQRLLSARSRRPFRQPWPEAGAGSAAIRVDLSAPATFGADHDGFNLSDREVRQASAGCMIGLRIG
jgi:hypothetical protein